MTAAKRLVILTAEGLEHHYVANTLCRNFAIEAIIVHTPPRRTLPQRIRRHGLLGTLRRLPAAFYRRMIGDEREKDDALLRTLGPEMAGQFQHPELLRPVDGINGEPAVALLRELRPDAILVYGTPVVKDKVLKLASDLAFNMHTGISPHYRGADCWFWPIINKEAGMIGATLHECTSQIDGGRIFATAQARLQPDDAFYDLFARAVIAGAELYVQCVRDYLEGKLAGQPQDLSIGREYKVAMRTLAREIEGRRNVRRGLVRDHCRATASGGR